jgi:lysozyme family protein
MQHPYVTWKGGYEELLRTMVVERRHDVDVACQRILDAANWSRYGALEHALGIPASFTGALDYRESDCNPRTGLGQGDPWNQVSVHVPRGCGPFSSWLDAAIFYANYDHLNDNSAPWSLAYECWKGEIWNGLGYRFHGVPSTYLWAGTNHQHRGFYRADGEWDPRALDTRIGIMPIIVQIGLLKPELQIPFTSGPIADPNVTVSGIIAPLWVQQTMNKLHLVPPELDPLREDGIYGRRTREAVRAFQRTHGLDPDGICGSKTAIALMKEPEYA